MATQPKVVIFGAGGIGSEAKRQVQEAGMELVGMFSKRARFVDDVIEPFDKPGDVEEVLYHLRRLCEVRSVDLGLLAIPSGGDGSTELRYIQTLRGYGADVVTAGKSAVANKFAELMPSLYNVGTTATVGGGTRILPFLKGWLDLTKPFSIGLVVNGTMSKISSDVWRGRGLDAASKEAVRLKYAEPDPDGKPDPLKIFSGEIEDVQKKLTIIRNIVLREMIGVGTPEDIKVVPLDMPYLRTATAQNSRMKYVASIGTEDLPIEGLDEGSPGSLSAKLGDVYVKAGFCHIPQGSAMDRWVPDDGPGNAVKLDQGGLPLVLSGEGAGPEATVGSMMKDAFSLLRRRSYAKPSLVKPDQSARAPAHTDYSLELHGPLARNH